MALAAPLGTTASLVPADPLARIEERVLWLSAAMVHAANVGDRRDPDGLKVGGHQASSASMVSIMTALWFTALKAQDRVSVKPHASPVLHAVNFLLGHLDPEQMGTLRGYRGVQSYPSRNKDPDPVDYSTGSVGIGATAPIWGAVARRYVEDLTGREHSRGRQYSLLGDAELDEGAVWEAVLDQNVAELGELVWIVDFNRQSLDRVVPNISATRLQGIFTAAGWQVITLKYGRLLEDQFAAAGGDALRRRIDSMTNPEYQRLLRCTPQQIRDRLPGSGEDAAPISSLLAGLPDDDVLEVVSNLGGHDLDVLREAFEQIDDTRPTVIFAYTIKGHGLPNAGHPQNHSNLLTPQQMAELGAGLGMTLDQPWQRFSDGSAEADLCAATAARLHRDPLPATPRLTVPADLGHRMVGHSSTQQALGRFLLDLTRAAPAIARRIVTVAPDVASSTNLGGWLNKVGAWSSSERQNWFADDAETILHWRERPTGQHIELGIAEVNLVGLLGELGATWSRWGEPLFPIGTLYDPFVNRALEPWSFGIYSGGQSILVGTPSGVTLAPEGGAHQSIIMPSIGIEQPGCVAFEPAFAQDLQWCLLDALSRLGQEGGSSSYFRLSTRPMDQTLAAVPPDAVARERRRSLVVAGGYPMRRPDRPAVTLVGMGAVMPEVLRAADHLMALDVPADVVCVTSADRLYRAVRGRRGFGGDAVVLDSVFPSTRAVPMVTVLDGHPHTLAFLATVRGVASTNLGVTEFGQTGTIQQVYREHGIDEASIVRAALELAGRPA